MLAKFVLMFLIKFFYCSTEMHSYNTRFAFSRNFVVNSILQECRSYANLWSSISPDVRRLPKFKFRKTLGHCLIAFSRYERTHPNLVSQAREIEILCGLQIGRSSRFLQGLWASFSFISRPSSFNDAYMTSILIQAI